MGEKREVRHTGGERGEPMLVMLVVAAVAAGYDDGGVAVITVEGCVDRWSGATSRGAGCCVAMVTANGPGRPLRGSIYRDYYVRVRGTSGLEILLNFICAVLFLLAFFLFFCRLSWTSRMLQGGPQYLTK